MQSKASTVEQYLAELPEDRREAVQAIRQVILRNLPQGYEEGMQYGMIGYFVPHRIYPAGYHCDPQQPLPFACLASQKNYISIRELRVRAPRASRQRSGQEVGDRNDGSRTGKRRFQEGGERMTGALATWAEQEKAMRPSLRAILLGAAFLVLAPQAGWAQPRPGDVFREYRWTNTGGDAGGSLRVGGRLDYGGGPITWPHDLDLAAAVRAEVVIEKLLCHDGTRGLAISLNDQDWIAAPEAAALPDPPWDYQHHTYPVVPVPLDQLKSGGGNHFRLKVDEAHPRNWPQNLIYGVHLRVYYDSAQKPHPTGRVLSPATGAVLGANVDLDVEASSPNGRIRQVDFLGEYEDVNLEGDGAYSQWHCHYVRGALAGHLGSVTAAPWKRTWDTSWVPDQPAPLRLAARITDQTELTYFTAAVEGLTLKREGQVVELCKPYDVPAKWVTRTGEKSERFRIAGDLNRAVAAQLVWVSWSPGYMNGLSINGCRVFDGEGPRYAYFVHRVPLQDLSVLRPGENTLETGLTPKYNGKMVHGMEVNWPGIMVLIRYRP